MRRVLYPILSLVLLACGGSAASDSSDGGLKRYTVEVIETYPHDRGAFTQGLLIDKGVLFESTGRHGQSSLRQVDLESGQLIKGIALPSRYFGEGIAAVDNRLFMLTWTSGDGFVFDRNSLQRTGSFSFAGEGWGLTTDGATLIMSNGTDELQFFDPDGFEKKRSVKVTRDGKPVQLINELEWIDGLIWANVWQTEDILQINPKTGKVVGVIDASGLLPDGTVARPRDDVLNGIAWNKETDQLYLTGKSWPSLFEIKLVEQSVPAN